MARLMTWLEAQKHLHPPKGPMGSGIAYTLNHWTELTRFIENLIATVVGSGARAPDLNFA